MRSASGRPGLITQEKILKMLLMYAPTHPELESNYLLALLAKSLHYLVKKTIFKKYI